jgi:transposase
MSSINKKSVRQEVNKIKVEFDQLITAGKINKECIAIMRRLLLVIDLILSVFLEKSTKKNSKNSSMPPSQTNKDETTPDKKGSNGKGKFESNAIADNTRTKETVTLSQVNQCNVCGEDLSQITSHPCERRTKIDIIFEKVVEHVDAEIKTCPTCESTSKGKFPSDMHSKQQYGNGLKAYIINLIVCQMVALNRTQKLIKSMIGVLISEASMLKFILRLHQTLADWESSAVDQILKSQSINVDETSLRVNKKNHWIHVYSSGEITLKFLHRKRGTEAIDAIDIIPRYGGSIVHDCWSSYFAYKNCGHGLCGSHLLRELTFIIESNQYAWATNMKRLLQETCQAVSKSKRKKLTKQAYANLQKRYRNIISRGEKELPAIPLKPKGQRGRMAKSDAHNLWERFKDHEAPVLLFAKDAHVSFTNNRAERDLRMAKVKQKVSGCFRNIIYAEAYCRISSYLQTMASRGCNPLIAIQMALSGKVELWGE